MRLFFWDFNDVNDIQRQWVMFAINCIAVLFTTYCLIKTARFNRQVTFELLPLSINTVGTIILLFIKLFEKGYQFDLVAFIIEIFTYFLFCYTFSLLHSRILKKQRKAVQNFCCGLLVLLASGSLIVIILVMTAVIERSCDNDLLQGSLACLATELVSYIPTLYFGMDILRNIEKTNQNERSQGSELVVMETITDSYIRERKKQIKLVLSAFTISLLLRAIILIFNINFDDYFTCSECEGVYILTSDYAMGQVLLVLIEINQLIPHIIIPIALFVIPAGRQSSGKRINLEQTLLEDEEGEDDHGDMIQRRISRSIVSNRGSVMNQDSLIENESPIRSLTKGSSH